MQKIPLENQQKGGDINFKHENRSGLVQGIFCLDVGFPACL